MRAYALAALIGLGLIAAAEARPWTDPAGRLVIDVPTNARAPWVVSPQRTDGTHERSWVWIRI